MPATPASDEISPLTTHLAELPINAVMDVSRKQISDIVAKFFNSLDELLLDIASYMSDEQDVRNIIGFRRLLQAQNHQVTHEIVTLFTWSLIPGDNRSAISAKRMTINDMHLNTMVTKLRESHLLQLQSIEKLYPRIIQTAKVDHTNNPFDPIKIYGIAYAVFDTLNIDDNSKNLCLREFHYVLKDHLRSFYDTIIQTMFH